jgi:hypothetical protein
VPEAEARDSHHISEKMRSNLLTRLRHVSRQATLPGQHDFGCFFISEVRQLPTVEFDEPYFGEVHFGDSAFLPTALTMELVVKAGELPAAFEPPVFEGVLLDAM